MENLLPQPLIKVLTGNIIPSGTNLFLFDNFDYSGIYGYFYSGDCSPSQPLMFSHPEEEPTKFIAKNINSFSYKKSGQYTLTAEIFNSSGNHITLTNTITISQNSQSGPFELKVFDTIWGKNKQFNGYVASYIDHSGNTNLPLSDYKAIIDWGDSRTSIGTITQTGTVPNGEYLISGSHIYCDSGKYNVSVIIEEIGKNSSYSRGIWSIYKK